MAALSALTGARPVLLTGDNPGAAGRLAEEVGITDVRAGLLPADKVAEVKTLQAAGHQILLVGDGVNDAPAMAAADLGVAMGRHGQTSRWRPPTPSSSATSWRSCPRSSTCPGAPTGS